MSRWRIGAASLFCASTFALVECPPSFGAEQYSQTERNEAARRGVDLPRPCDSFTAFVAQGFDRCIAISYDVLASGEVENVRITDVNPPEVRLPTAWLVHMENWRVEPYLKDGKPVDCPNRELFFRFRPGYKFTGNGPDTVPPLPPSEPRTCK